MEGRGQQVSRTSSSVNSHQLQGRPWFGIWGEIGSSLFDRARDFVEHEEQLDGLNVLVESYGGYANEAFKTAALLQNCCRGNMTVYVPRVAKSAGTLVCLAGKEIVLWPEAELGPLDTQVRDPRGLELGPLRYVSALTVNASLSSISDFLLGQLDLVLMKFMKVTGGSMDATFPLVMQYLKGLTDSVLQPLSPLDVGIFRSALDMSEQYAVELLERAGTKSPDARRIAGILVGYYPAHSYVIDFPEAKERIQLPCRLPDDDERQAVRVLRTYCINNSVKGTFYGRI